MKRMPVVPASARPMLMWCARVRMPLGYCGEALSFGVLGVDHQEHPEALPTHRELRSAAARGNGTPRVRSVLVSGRPDDHARGLSVDHWWDRRVHSVAGVLSVGSVPHGAAWASPSRSAVGGGLRRSRCSSASASPGPDRRPQPATTCERASSGSASSNLNLAHLIDLESEPADAAQLVEVRSFRSARIAGRFIGLHGGEPVVEGATAPRCPRRSGRGSGRRPADRDCTLVR